VASEAPLTSGPSRLFLLDGMALAYRAHFALARNPLATSKGLPTGAVFGFLLTLDRILSREKPERIAVVFDAPEPTFRHKAYAEYKATREKMPDELVPQLEWIRRVVEGRGIPFLRVPGYEADDVIGTLAARESARGHDVWIVSGDKDMTQLVGPRVRLYNVQRPRADEVELVDEAGVLARWGVPPARVIDVLGLMGDASDNVPGVPGVGEKTAQRLVVDHGTLEKVLEAGASLPQKRLAQSLVEHAEQARLSKRLVTIATDVPLDAAWDDLALRAQDVAALREAYRELEFQDRLAGLPPDARAAGERRYRTVTTPEELDALVAALRASKATGGFALDTETTGVDPMRAELVGLSFSWAEGEAWYVPVNRDPPIFGGEARRERGDGLLFAGGPRSSDAREVLARLAPVLEDPTVPKTGQNAKYDAIVLAEQREGDAPAGAEVRGIAFDTMVADFCLRPDARTHNLDALSLDRLGIKKIPTTDLIGTGKSQVTMREVPIERVAEYACEDADCTWRLRRLLEPELAATGLDRVFRDVEMPLLPVLARMERAGIRLDVSALERLGKSLAERATALEASIQALAGEPVNLRSNAQVGALLFEKLRLHEAAGRRQPRRTQKGTGFATDERTLLELADAHPIPKMLLDWRTLTKLASTYVEPLPTYVNPRTGRVHTTFHPTGAATGRLSSSDPNLQNIPARGEEGRAIRSAFVAPPGWRLLSADYSQVELRLLAHLAGDPGLAAAFAAGEDVHRATAARVFGVAAADVTPELRGRAKAVNFGVIYGMGAMSLAQQTGVTMAEAESFIEAYFRAYPNVRSWEEAIVAEARKRGYVTTLLGRRRPLPEIASDDPRMRSAAERVAVNTPIQGTAAEMIKLAMIAIDRRLADERFRSRMLLQVHDELVFEVPPEEEARLEALVREEMASALVLTVPIVVDVGLGASWADAH
jgi:DNA polymerase-1